MQLLVEEVTTSVKDALSMVPVWKALPRKKFNENIGNIKRNSYILGSGEQVQC